MFGVLMTIWRRRGGGVHSAGEELEVIAKAFLQGKRRGVAVRRWRSGAPPPPGGRFFQSAGTPSPGTRRCRHSRLQRFSGFEYARVRNVRGAVSSSVFPMCALFAFPASRPRSLGRVLSVPFQLIPLRPPLGGALMEWLGIENGPHVPARCMIGGAEDFRLFSPWGGARFNPFFPAERNEGRGEGA